MAIKFDLVEFNQQILKLMQEHGTNWAKQWFEVSDGAPQNAENNRLYHGMNVWLLMFSSLKNNYKINKWGTFKAWSRMGYSVKKGEHGTTVYFHKFFENEETNKKGMFVKSFTEFNAEQVWTHEDHEPYLDPNADKPKPYMTEGSELVEQIIREMNIEIHYGGNIAAYSPTLDRIVHPHLEQFKTAVMFDSTRLHEITHWTGGEKRLNRHLTTDYSSQQYAQEELVAELSSAALCSILGLEQTPQPDHAQYLNNWMQNLKTDKTYFKNASKSMWAAVEYICVNGKIDVEFSNGTSNSETEVEKELVTE